MSAGQTMTVVTRDRFGAPDVLRIEQAAVPEVSGSQVLVRVHAAGVNRGDALAVRGWPYVARLVEHGVRRPRHPVPGNDVSGTVEAVGPEVSGLAPGDEVFGWAEGAFAELAVAEEGDLVPRPANVTNEQAAAVPSAATAALQAVQSAGRAEPGQQVLVVGASGGVGTFAVEVAAWLGAEVTGVSSGANASLVRSVGASQVIDHTRQDFTEQVGRFDLIVDLVGNRELGDLRRALTRKGTLVVVGGQNPRSFTGMGRFASAALRSPFVSQRLVPLFARPDADDLRTVSGLIEDGRLLPVIDRQLDLVDAATALRHLETGHAKGRVVLLP